MTSITPLVLMNLTKNEDYARKVVPYIKPEYFQQNSEKLVFEIIDSYIKKYNSIPSKETVLIELSNRDNVGEKLFEETKSLVISFDDTKHYDEEWLVDQTEEFCQDRAIYNAIMKSIEIIDDKNQKESKGAIPGILTEALSVSFDTHIGHDYIDNVEERFDFYHRKEKRIPFDLEYFNKITGGGLPVKTLNIALAGTGVGKSLFMCHCAAANISAGYNVLYITLEMAEERIAERIDANLLDVQLDELEILPKETFFKKFERFKNKILNFIKKNNKGKLIIKEYPTASAGSANFRHLINELKLKKNFKPDIIYIDYINICASSRLRYGANVNSYTLIKAIAEELRGLAVEFGVPVVSATQTTRGGYSNSDVGLEDTSESFGLPATADFMFALITSEELEGLGQIKVKQLKNRYSDVWSNRGFVVGVDRSRMRLYDVEQEAQDLIDGPVMDRTKFGEEDFERTIGKTKFDRSAFDGFR